MEGPPCEDLLLLQVLVGCIIDEISPLTQDAMQLEMRGELGRESYKVW